VQPDSRDIQRLVGEQVSHRADDVGDRLFAEQDSGPLEIGQAVVRSGRHTLL